MKKIYLKTVLLIVFISLFVMVAEAAVDFAAPIIDPENWTKRFDSSWHTNKDVYAYDFNRNGGDAGQPVYATADGKIAQAVVTTGSGGVIFINHDGIFQSDYRHLKANFLVRKGDYVKQGQLIGYVGNSIECGIYCNGGHLHFSIHKIGNNASLSAHDLSGIPAFANIRLYGSGGVVAKGIATVKDFYYGKDVGGASSEPLKPVDLKPIGDMVTKFYNWALDIGAAVALGIVIWGGVLYISSAGDPGKQTEAKKWVKAAILGLVLLLSAYLILYTINPCFVGVGSECV